MSAPRRPLLWSAVAAALAWAAGGASAQGPGLDYPTHTVTIVAPASPGGLYSLFARLVGAKLEQRFGKPFIVENRPGASSIVGILSVIRSAPDGHTLIVANNTGMAVNVTMHKSLPYDPLKDLIPVGLIATIPEVLVVNAAGPIRSLGDIAAAAKAAPGQLTYGSPGAGTGPHLSGVVLAGKLGIELTHIPYKGMSPAISDVAGGHVSLMFSPIPVALPLAQAGKLRMLGVTSAERIEAIPDVPPLAEIGLKGFDAVSWFMLVAPAGTPDAIIGRLNAEVRAMTADVGLQQEFARLGLVPVVSPRPAELRDFVRSEIELWGGIARQAGLAGVQ